MIQILIALDQLANSLLRGMADETLSARAFRRELQGSAGRARRMIDALFFWQPNHRFHSWRAEFDRRQLPSHYGIES